MIETIRTAAFQYHTVSYCVTLLALTVSKDSFSRYFEPASLLKLSNKLQTAQRYNLTENIDKKQAGLVFGGYKTSIDCQGLAMAWAPNGGP